MKILRQSTTRNVMVFMADATDHIAGKTGLTLTITASKDGADFASITPTVTERDNGWYNIALTAGMTDTLGDYIIRATGTLADPSDIPCMVQGGLTDADVSAIPNNVWNTAIPGAFADGTTGYKLDNLRNPVFGSAAVSVRASAFTLTTGSQTGTYTNTLTADGVVHSFNDTGNVIDGYYEFDVGLDGVPVSISALANVQSANDSVSVYGYNWGTTSWEQIGTIPGTGSSSLQNFEFQMQIAHVAVGASPGKVRVRFYTTGGTNPSLQIDYMYLSYAIVQRSATFTGLAQAGGASTLTFPAIASASDGYYFPGMLVLTSGTGVGQSRRIEGYVGSTKVATVATPWVVQPDSTTVFSVYPWASTRVSEIDTDPANVIAANIMATVVENSIPLADVLRILLAYAAGDASGLDTNPVFKAQNGTTTRLAGTLTSSTRTITTINGA